MPTTMPWGNQINKPKKGNLLEKHEFARFTMRMAVWARIYAFVYLDITLKQQDLFQNFIFQEN